MTVGEALERAETLTHLRGQARTLAEYSFMFDLLKAMADRPVRNDHDTLAQVAINLVQRAPHAI